MFLVDGCDLKTVKLTHILLASLRWCQLVCSVSSVNLNIIKPEVSYVKIPPAASNGLVLLCVLYCECKIASCPASDNLVRLEHIKHWTSSLHFSHFFFNLSLICWACFRICFINVLLSMILMLHFDNYDKITVFCCWRASSVLQIG